MDTWWREFDWDGFEKLSSMLERERPRRPLDWPWEATDILLAVTESAARALTRQAAPDAETAALIRAFHERVLGSFYGDLYAARRGDPSAFQRLGAKYFPRGAVFHPDRWRLLEPAFSERRGDGSFRQAWLGLAVPALALAVKEVPGDVRLGEVYRWLRGHVRTEIERDLLDGRTLDRRGEVLLPDTPEAEALEREVQAEAEALMFLLVELMAGLSGRELAILLAQHGDDAALAEQYGTTVAAIQKERQRIKEKLRANFA